MKRSLWLFGVLGIALSSLAIIFTPQVHAVSTAAFDPTRIIDDSVFYNSSSMTVDQIQAFLNSKVPVCDNWGTNGSTSTSRANYAANNGQLLPLTCLKGYYENPSTHENNLTKVSGQAAPIPPGAQSAAQIISIASTYYGINPQVLIVLLQKEQGLVTDDWPFAYQYQAATGYGCPDTAVCNSQYYGFWNQVNHAAAQFRNYANYPNSFNYVPGPGNFVLYNPSSSCGGSYLNIQNQATASLYDYTPYQPNAAALAAGYGLAPPCGAYGNRNFWLYFNDWFGSTSGTFLLQSPASPAVYLQSGTTRYGIPSYDVLRAYGFAKTKVTPVSDTYMNSLTDGGTLGTTFTVEGQGAVYLADNGYRFGFSTQQQCADWGVPSCLTTATTKPLSPYLFSLILNGGDLKRLMLNGTAIYLMQSGNKRPFLTYPALLQNGFTASDITPVTSPINSNQPIGYSLPENNSFVKFGASPVFYAYSGGAFYAINSYDVLRSLIAPSSVVMTDNASLYVSSPPTPAGIIPSIVSTAGGTKKYVLSGGYKYDITNVASDWPAAQALDALGTIIDAKPTQAIVDASTTFRLPTGLLFRVQGSSITPFYNLADFFKSPFNKSPLAISDAVQNMSMTTPYITPGGGTLYQLTDPTKQQMIFLRDIDGSACALSSQDQLGAFRFDASNVYRISDSAVMGPALQSLVQAQDGATYIVYRGTRIPVSAQTLTSWGVGAAARCSFSNVFLGTLPVAQNSKSFSFARLSSGLIYYAQGNAAHQILTYSTFLSMGGSANNTVDVPDDFLSYVTLGNSIN